MSLNTLEPIHSRSYKLLNPDSASSQQSHVVDQVLTGKKPVTVCVSELVNTPVSPILNSTSLREAERVQYIGAKFQILLRDVPLTIHSLDKT